jgi:non-specific serine/threonine protein kinase/serine/threonine-protein kinase
VIPKRARIRQVDQEPSVADASEYWAEVEAVFADAVDLEPTSRASFLTTRCVGRPDVRAEVESLLAAHAQATGFMRPVTISPASAEPPPVTSLGAGSLVGAFRLVDRIGTGGMGTVYRAERADGGFEQQVAVKLVTASLHHPDAARRFRAERQILASLRHPHIVTLLDGGVTPAGQPYLAMEYVDGVPITAYCRERRLPLAARLGLFAQVCSAVQYAHRHFVVHRDLKPANILVTADGVAKVLDFGVAKLLDDPGGTAPSATLAGLGPLTPNYASPEQLRGSPVTTSSDVYALGVLLYELLTGRRPYETEGKALDEVLRLVLETEPARPSALPAPVESGLPYQPRRALRGDLDAVVSRAMAKEPERRYASAEELAGDLARHLGGQPVVAREPSLAYLVRKLAARHRTAVAVALVSLGLVVTALAVVVWQHRVAGRAQARAEQRFQEVRTLANSLIFKIHDAVAPLAGSTPVRRMIVSEGLTYLDRLAAESADDPALRLELAMAYVKIGYVQFTRGGGNLGDRQAAISSHRKAKALVEGLIESPAPDRGTLRVWTDVHIALAGVLDGAERVDAAREALKAATRRHELDPGSPDAQALLARAHFQVAVELRGPESLPHWLEADRLYNLILTADPGNVDKQRNAALTAKYLGNLYQPSDRPRALEHYRRALALDERRAQRLPDDMSAQNDLAIDIGNLASIHSARKEYDDCIRLYERSLAVRQRIAGADPANVYARSRVAFVHYKLASCYNADGQKALALRHAHRAIELGQPLTLIDPLYKTQQAAVFRILGWIHEGAGRRGAACDAYRSAAELFKAGGPITDPGWRGDAELAADKAARCGAD